MKRNNRIEPQSNRLNIQAARRENWPSSETIAPKAREQIIAYATSEFLISGDDPFKTLLFRLGADQVFEMSVNWTYYCDYVHEILDFLEEHSALENRLVKNFIQQALRWKPDQSKQIVIKNDIPRRLSSHQINSISNAMNEGLGLNEVNHIILLFDHRAASCAMHTPARVRAVIAFALEQNRLSELIQLIYSEFPFIDFSEIGLMPQIRTPHDIRALRNYLHMLTPDAALKLNSTETQNKIFDSLLGQSELVLKIAKLLGYVDRKTTRINSMADLFFLVRRRKEFPLVYLAYYHFKRKTLNI